MLIGAYPGTFNPPTVAHLAIAEAAVNQGGLDRLDLVLSLDPLGKKDARLAGPVLAHRLALFEPIVRTRRWLSIRTTDHRLITEIAAGYDAVVLGSDKWLQVIDPSWYGGSVEARDSAVAALPRLLIAPRANHPLPAELPAGALLLQLDVAHSVVSSTAVRAGRREWMAPEVSGHPQCRNRQNRAD